MTPVHEFGAWLFFHEVPMSPFGIVGVIGLGAFLHAKMQRLHK